MRKLGYIALNFVPIVVMIALIPIIKNDHLLAVVYLIIVAVSLFIKRDEKDFLVFFLGLVMLTISETIFVSTGVETFVRRSLFNLMPIWLPILWGYGFIAIKRGVLAL